MPSNPYAVLSLGRHRNAQIPEDVRDEAVVVPPGETRYWLLLTDEMVELLARGIVSEATSLRAFEMLGWKRDAQRVASQALASPKKRKRNAQTDKR